MENTGYDGNEKINYKDIGSVDSEEQLNRDKEAMINYLGALV